MKEEELEEIDEVLQQSLDAASGAIIFAMKKRSKRDKREVAGRLAEALRNVADELEEELSELSEPK